MNTISEHIYYLIRHHDCVVVPGWGALVAQYCPATADAVKGVIMPPSRALGFNATIQHNDGMLASSVARRNGIGYDAAVAIVADEVNTMRHQLELDGEVAIPRVGIFRKGEEDVVVFEPFGSAGISSEFLGLEALTVKPLSQLPSDTEQADDDRKKDVVYLPISRNIFKIAASLLLIIGLGFMLSTPITVDSDAVYASISTPQVSSPKPVQLKPTDGLELIVAIPSHADGVAVVDTVATECEQPVAVADVTEDAGIASLRFDESDGYCLVIASLASRELAEQYMDESGEGSLGLLEKDGKFRVYAATGTTFSQAMSPTRDAAFAAKYPGAWVCRR